MSRNLKVLGLALVAVFAMSVMGASAASAALFHGEQAPLTITSRADGTGTTGHHVFDAAGRNITCTEANFTGTQSVVTPETQFVEGNYGGCTFIGINVNVNMNGCGYLFNANGGVTIQSRTGKNCATEPITFEAKVLGIPCKVEVGPQALTGITYHNLAGNGTTTREITLEAAVNGIKYNASGGACGETGTGLTNGQYTTGNTIIKGETSAGVQKGVFWG